MKTSLALFPTLTLILSLSQTAWAVENDNIMKTEANCTVNHGPDGCPGYLEYRDADITLDSYKSDTDRFLAEKVWPSVEEGDKRLKDCFKGLMYPDYPEVAIAKYLRALVEIEAEKLRRGK